MKKTQKAKAPPEPNAPTPRHIPKREGGKGGGVDYFKEPSGGL